MYHIMCNDIDGFRTNDFFFIYGVKGNDDFQFLASSKQGMERNHDEVDCDTSISRCESERGTHGRGTPPVRDKGQPQLDELFRKLQV